jgi:beta-lactamase class A
VAYPVAVPPRSDFGQLFGTAAAKTCSGCVAARDRDLVTSVSLDLQVEALGLEGFLSRLPDRGSFSVWAGPVAGEPVVALAVNRQHYAASTIKLALVLAAYREAESGRLDLDRRVEVHNKFASAADGTPYSLDRNDDNDPRVWRRLGASVTLRWLCYRAIVSSSNLATNLVLEVVGVEAVSLTLAEAGATSSSLTRGIEDTAAREAGLSNRVTAADLAVTLQRLAGGLLLDDAGTTEVLAVLAAQQINDAIPAGLPPTTRVAHKSGWVEGVSHDAAIIFPPDARPFLFVMCTTSDLAEQASLELIAAGAAAAWADRKVLG